MIALIGRARTLWAIAAPVARPLIASAVIGWGLATLGNLAEQRREQLAELDRETAERLGELQQYHRDLAAAEQLAHDYSRELAKLREQLSPGRLIVPTPPSAKMLREHANVSECHHPSRGGNTVAWMREVAAIVETNKSGTGEGTPEGRGIVAGATIEAGPAETPAPAPVATEPGCQHEACVLIHPHAGPAYLTPEAAELMGLGDAIDWERLTEPAAAP